MWSFVLLLGLFNLSGALCQNLSTALGDVPQLSELVSVLALEPQLLAGLSNVTLLAPNNQAIAALPNATIQALTANPALLEQVLSYHFLLGNYPRITENAFIPTLLQQNVTGGQRVNAVPSGGSTTFYCGLLQNASTIDSTITFDGGSIHIINSLLTLPVNVSTTSVALNLTSAVGAINSAGLTQTIDTTADLTVFVPNNAAFRQIGGSLQSLSTDSLSAVLQYHVVAGNIYSNGKSSGVNIQTLQGKNMTLTLRDGYTYVNNAQIVLANVLTANGVIHVIDQVLNPDSNAGFAGAASVTSDVFTDGVQTPTSVIDTATMARTASGAAGSSANSGSSEPSGGSGNGALSTGAKVAIGVVVPLAVIGAVVAAVLLTRRHMLKKNRTPADEVNNTASSPPEKPELAGTMGRTATGESGVAYAKPELASSKSPRRTETGIGTAPVRYEVEGEGVSASIKNAAELTSHERHELEGEGHGQYASRNR